MSTASQPPVFREAGDRQLAGIRGFLNVVVEKVKMRCTFEEQARQHQVVDRPCVNQAAWANCRASRRAALRARTALAQALDDDAVLDGHEAGLRELAGRFLSAALC